MTDKLRAAALIAAFWWGASLPGFAQKIELATVQGQISDPDNLPISGASVTLRNTLTGISRVTKADATGRYLFESVRPGNYWLGAAQTGLSERGETFEVDKSTQTVNLQLPIAGVRQEVTVVSSSRIEELQMDSPVKVEAVTREQMQDSGNRRVSDVLAELPGVVTRRGSTSSVGGEQIQGIDSRQVLVLMDGLPIPGARGVKSGALNLNRQSSDRLQRIEVVKGAASSRGR